MKLQTMGDEHEKQELINEAKTLRFSLTRNDRKFLRAYLGYEKVVQNIPNRVLKKKSEACYFVQRALWAKGKKKSIQKSNNSKENEKEEDKEGEEGEEEEEEEEEEREEEEEEEEEHHEINGLICNGSVFSFYKIDNRKYR